MFLNNPQGTGLFFRQKAQFLHYSLWEKLTLWYGYATEAVGKLSDDQIAEYIGMPRILVPPVRWIDNLVKAIKRKR